MPESAEPKANRPGNVTIAVVIPNYNHAELLPIALESVVTQSRQPDVIYILDDKSTDNSVEVAQKFCDKYPHMKLIRREKNLGVFPNINEFIPKVTTTFTLVLSADDYILPGYIEDAHAILTKHPDAGICTAESITLMVDGTTKIYPMQFSKEPVYFSPQEFVRAARGNFTGQCFYHTKALQKLGGFPPELKWYSDPFAGWVVAGRHGVCYLTKPGAVFRASETSYSGAGAKSRKQQREVLMNSLEFLRRPDLEDVKPIFRDAHVLSIYDDGLFTALCKDKRNHYFLTPSFLRMLAWRHIRRRIRHPLPDTIKYWIRRKFNLKGQQPVDQTT